MKDRQRTVHDRVGAGIGMLVGASVALAPVVPASADVLRCSIPEASQGESAQLIIRADLRAGALAKPALSYRSRRIFDPCRLEEFQPEPLGFPSGLALAK